MRVLQDLFELKIVDEIGLRAEEVERFEADEEVPEEVMFSQVLHSFHLDQETSYLPEIPTLPRCSLLV